MRAQSQTNDIWAYVCNASFLCVTSTYKREKHMKVECARYSLQSAVSGEFPTNISLLELFTSCNDNYLR